MIQRLLILIFCFLLTACATMPAKKEARNENLTWPQRQAHLQTIHSWQITGAMAYHTPQGGQSASLVWQQTEEQSQHNYQISLFGPLGVGRVSLVGTLGKNVILTRDGKTFTAHTPEMLMQQQLGWHLPISNLYYWVRGLPAPGIAKKIEFDPFHHVTTLVQQGWTIHYERYTAVNDLDLPSKFTLQHGSLTVKVVINKWNN
jgi:outer membrane lipoprotein LolB